MSTGGFSRFLLITALAAGLAGCGLPRDPEQASERIEGKVLRAGVSENPPWIRFEGAAVTGVEADLIRTIAADVGARVEWRRGGESALMKSLKENQLDLVAGGVTTQSPWSRELGATQPYLDFAGEKHLVLAPPGENRWITRIDRVVQAHRQQIAGWAAAETARR